MDKNTLQETHLALALNTLPSFPTQEMANFIHSELSARVPTLQLRKEVSVPRFLHGGFAVDGSSENSGQAATTS